MVSAILVPLAKTVTTLVTIRMGERGGTLTPDLALGAGLEVVTGLPWSQTWPGTSITAFVLISTAVFLRTSMRAPLTGLILLMEFTHQDSGILAPTILAIGGAVAATAWVERMHTEAK